MQNMEQKDRLLLLVQLTKVFLLLILLMLMLLLLLLLLPTLLLLSMVLEEVLALWLVELESDKLYNCLHNQHYIPFIGQNMNQFLQFFPNTPLPCFFSVAQVVSTITRTQQSMFSFDCNEKFV
jgi:hypothetical protein